MANNKITFNKFHVDSTTQSKNFVYKDLHAFKNKRVNTTNDIDIIAIYNSLKNLMEFRRGQRILDVNFGNPLYDYLYDPLVLVFNMKESLKNYLETYEPRISIVSIDIAKNDDKHEIFLNIKYTILNEDKFTDNFSIVIGE